MEIIWSIRIAEEGDPIGLYVRGCVGVFQGAESFSSCQNLIELSIASHMLPLASAIVNDNLHPDSVIAQR